MTTTTTHPALTIDPTAKARHARALEIEEVWNQAIIRMEQFADEHENPHEFPLGERLSWCLMQLRVYQVPEELAPGFILSAVVPVIVRLVSAGRIRDARRVVEALRSVPVDATGTKLKDVLTARPLLDWLGRELGDY
ncbi:hypothetical protein OH491_25975 [Termitidicoccus mucosus]|uniref:Uncharacterized protein n=1 Tax=Termitidicoccus mucosus TaxID=1184151 RepID=A0A178IKE0_9BACT|nr:hypothetical protein AW736_00565 [Opitutaceae bacterium TSB47]